MSSQEEPFSNYCTVKPAAHYSLNVLILDLKETVFPLCFTAASKHSDRMKGMLLNVFTIELYLSSAGKQLGREDEQDFCWWALLPLRF